MSLINPKRSPKSIGLVGHNKSGIKEASKIFGTLGIPSFNVDLAFRMVINYDKETKHKVRSYFGDDSFVDENLNKYYFDTPFKMLRLVEIAEEKVFKKFFSWKKRQESDFVIFRSTILHGVFNPVNFYKIISVYSPVDIYENGDGDGDGDVDVEEYPLKYLKENSDFVINLSNSIKSDLYIQVGEISNALYE